jgi:hypothetical protein
MKLPKTFEGACRVMKLDPAKVLPKVSTVPKKHQKALVATFKLYVIIEAINYLRNGKKGWAPNFNDYNERKYYPWWDMEKTEDTPSGFRLYGVYCAFVLERRCPPCIPRSR